MGGVVFANPNGLLGKFGDPITLAAGATIPPGMFFSAAAWTAMIDGTPTAMPPGIVNSDGQATSAGGQVVPMGAGQEPNWPWPLPWPLGQPWWP